MPPCCAWWTSSFPRPACRAVSGGPAWEVACCFAALPSLLRSSANCDVARRRCGPRPVVSAVAAYLTNSVAACLPGPFGCASKPSTRARYADPAGYVPGACSRGRAADATTPLHAQESCGHAGRARFCATVPHPADPQSSPAPGAGGAAEVSACARWHPEPAQCHRSALRGRGNRWAPCTDNARAGPGTTGTTAERIPSPGPTRGTDTPNGE